MEDQPILTTKARKTRQRILDTAIELFTMQGYEETTLRDIAAKAECSLGLAYRYFARKEDFVIALYEQLLAETEAQVANMPHAPLIERFQRVMEAKFAQIAPYREAMGALFSALMNPKSDVAVLGAGTADIRQRMHRVFTVVIAGATDAPREPQIRDFAILAYSVHLLLILFWLYDRSPNAKATHDLLAFASDGFGLVRPFLLLPPFAKSSARLAEILATVFGGGHVEQR